MTTPQALARITVRTALAGSLAIALAGATALATRAADDPDLQTMKLQTSGGWATWAALQVDTDGDGWADWVERLQGTDPKDPTSHPGHVAVEIVGTTVYVPSVAFPDRLVVVDLALPEGTNPATDLLDTVGTLAGIAPTGKLHDRLSEDLARLTGGDLLSGMVAAADKAHGGDAGFGTRTNGMDLSLISSGLGDWKTVKQIQEGIEFVQHNSIDIGMSTDGDPYVTVGNSEGSQTHVFGPGREVSSTLENFATDGDGSKVVHWTHLTNGVVDGFGKKVTHPDGTQEYWDYDGDGNLVAHGTVKTGSGGATSQPSSQPTGQATAQPSSSATGAAQPSSTGSSSTSSDPSSTSTPSSTSSGDYVDPDADPIVVPTDAEIAARVAFLSGVRIRIVQDRPQVGVSDLLPRPGVSDPAEPGCSEKRCVVFVDIQAPRLSNVTGGDPVNPDWAGYPAGPRP